jgi:hypothetical protein
MKDEALKLALEALESVLANHNGAPVLPWIEARDAIKQARALDKKAENTMIYRTFEQWKSGNVLEHGVPRTEHYTEDQLDLVEMGWNYGYDAGRAVEQALDKKAENARELGLDYEPADGTQVSKVWWDGEKLMAKPIPLEDFYLPAQPAPVQPVANREQIYKDAFEQGVHEGNFKAMHECRLNYFKLQDNTTPPAAKPAVPDAFGTREGEHPQYIEGWNDCRAEMLKGMKP